MTISLIAAVDKNFAIGKNNQIPWNLPADLKYFSSMTRDKSVIMGKNTYNSIINSLGHPLPKRKNIIVTSSPKSIFSNDCIVVNSLSEAINAADGDEIFIIGGAKLYEEAIKIANKIYLTHIDTEVESPDTYFPKLDPKEWSNTTSSFHEADTANIYNYSFTTYERK